MLSAVVAAIIGFYVTEILKKEKYIVLQLRAEQRISTNQSKAELYRFPVKVYNQAIDIENVGNAPLEDFTIEVSLSPNWHGQDIGEASVAPATQGVCESTGSGLFGHRWHCGVLRPREWVVLYMDAMVGSIDQITVLVQSEGFVKSYEVNIEQGAL